ncbi:MAG TPA: MFS transporter [Actinophytocola sp.]|uniref:MFS transporter n=1 Tax=Actinophytocola sp. TaxID=1872138 RepID=UPI002DBB8BB5|nr:MFS transporter [Actinophytocola sp.]HEU5469123.1 MFS transporter [Actinophytocola sp.]
MDIGRFGVPKQSRLLILISLIDSTGTGLFLAGSAVFFTRSIGLSPEEVGIGLTAGGLVALLSLTPLGMLADRIGPLPASVLLHLWRAVGFVGYAFVYDFPSFLIVCCFVTPPARAIEPIGQMFVDRHVGSELRMRVLSAIRVTYNLGFTLGALLATVVLVLDTRPAFLAIVLGDALTFLLAGVLLLRVPLLAGGSVARRAVSGWPRSLRQGRFLFFAGLNGFLMLHIPLVSVGIPLWTTLHTEAPRILVGPLIAVNTVLVLLLQMRLSRGTDTVADGIRVLRRAAVCLAGCCVVVAFAGQFGAFWASALLVAGMVLLTFGEILQVTGGWSLSYELAPRERQGEYLSVFNLGVAAMYLIGPTLITVGIIQRGIGGWLALAAFFAGIGLLVRPAVVAAKRQIDSLPKDQTADLTHP